MTHHPKRLLLCHDGEQWLVDPRTFAMGADATWSVFGTTPGYDEVTDRLALARPTANPQGTRSVDADTLLEIAGVQFGWLGSIYDSDVRGGKQIVSRLMGSGEPGYSPTSSLRVAVIDVATLTIDVEYALPNTAPFMGTNNQEGNRVAWLDDPSGGTHRYLLTAQTQADGMIVVNGTTVERVFTAPDPAWPAARAASADRYTGRVATVWNSSGGSGMYSSKIVVFEADLSTVVFETVPVYTYAGVPYDQMARAVGSTCFDPDGRHLWFYSGFWHSDIVTLAPGASSPQLYLYALDGSSVPTVGVVPPFPGGSPPADVGGHVLVYGADVAGGVRQRQIPGSVRQRQIPGIVRQRQTPR